tara:strand:+ start:9586 stop:10512 length:927 start_codon:yes stop_codon:yes gene_type:complete
MTEWHFKEAVDELEKGRPSPISSFRKAGGALWRRGEDRGAFFRSSYNPENQRSEYWILELQNKTIGKSGAVTVTMAEGWTATWFLYSENADFFSDNTKNALAAEAQIKQELLYDESLEITLSGGDYFSLDVDEEHKGIFRFRLKKDGVFVNIEDPENPNNEVFIAMKDATYSPPQTFSPHLMYDCETGQSYQADDQATHERLAALGFVHDLNECDSTNPPTDPKPDPNQCAPGFVFDPSTQTCVPEQNGQGGGGGGDEDEGGSPILGFLLLGLVAFGLWWLFSKPDSVKTESSGFTKSPPDAGGLGDA